MKKQLTHRILVIIILVIISAIGFVSCNQGPAKDSKEKIDEATSNLTGIYQYANNGDTIRLDLQTSDNKEVQGQLLFALYEKDRTDGSLKGTIKDSLLLASYSFSSEGVISERQIAFKFHHGVALPGYGKMEEVDGKLVFSNIDSLKFDDQFALRK